jgi:hypothetical protein
MESFLVVGALRAEDTGRLLLFTFADGNPVALLVSAGPRPSRRASMCSTFLHVGVFFGTTAVPSVLHRSRAPT